MRSEREIDWIVDQARKPLWGRISELEAAMKELIAATNEFVGWHRTDKIVVRDAERIEDWRRARDAAREILEKSA